MYKSVLPQSKLLVPGRFCHEYNGGSHEAAFVTETHLDYLDDLFDSSAIDVRHASPILGTVFRLSQQEAEAVVEFWSSMFGRRLAGS